MEGSSPANRAIHPDASAHDVHEPGGDGQAQARAAIFTRGRAVGLLEGVEDDILLVRRDADTGVGDGEVKRGLVVGHGLRVDGHGDAALFGEFDGVADQVEHDLHEPHRVAHESVGYLVGDVAAEIESLFLGAQGERFEGVAKQVTQGQGRGLQAEFACFNLGEIEDVVDDGQQRGGRDADGFQVIALLRAQVGLQRQVGHAHDAVHRRADFMTHVGQELALGPIGSLGGFLGLVQLDLGLFTLHHFMGERGLRSAALLDFVFKFAGPPSRCLRQKHRQHEHRGHEEADDESDLGERELLLGHHLR